MALILVGICIFVLGFLLTFFWTGGNADQGNFIVKANSTLKISWHLEGGDQAEGGFNVSGGNEEVRFYVESPSGEFIFNQTVKSLFANGFTAQDSGTYNLYFENMETIDKTVGLGFLAPYNYVIRLTLSNEIGLSMMLASMAILFYGAHVYRRA